MCVCVCGVRMRAPRTVRGVDAQVDRDVGDAFVGAGHAVRLILDLLTNHVEVGEHAPLAVQELRILCVRHTFWINNAQQLGQKSHQSNFASLLDTALMHSTGSSKYCRESSNRMTKTQT